LPKALLEWATKESWQLALIKPGKPWQNGTNESFNGKFRFGNADTNVDNLSPARYAFPFKLK